MVVIVPQKQGLLPVLVIDLTDQTDLVEHDTHFLVTGASEC
jgi:hypothetical protein